MPKINNLPQKHLIRLICSGIREVDLARKEENLEDPQETFLLTKPSAVINDRPRCTNLTCTHSLSLSLSLSLAHSLFLSKTAKHKLQLDRTKEGLLHRELFLSLSYEAVSSLPR